MGTDNAGTNGGDLSGSDQAQTTTTATSPDVGRLTEQVANLNKALSEARAKAQELEGYRQKHADTEAKLTEYQKREEVRLTSVKAETDTILQGMAEADRALVPDGIDADQRLALARRLAARLAMAQPAAQAQQPTAERPAGTKAATGAAAEVIPPECEAQAKRLGMKTPEQIREFLPVWLKTAAGKAWASGSTRK